MILLYNHHNMKPSSQSQPPIQYRKAIPTDFDGILHLQYQNLITALQEKDLSQGFLMIEFTREQLYKINGELGIFIAVQGKEVIGYLMAESVDFAVGAPLVAHMFSRLKEFTFDDVPLASCKLFVYGPVCIEKKHRGQKILNALFKFMLSTLQGQYDVGIAFVSALNHRSFSAHKNKLGMRIADEFEFKGQKYWTLVFTVEQKERKVMEVMKKQSLLKRVIRLILISLAAIWMLFEDWVWDTIVDLMTEVGRLKIINRFESFLTRQNQYLLLTLFTFPFLIVIPAKLYGLYLIADGKVIRGVTIFIVAEVLITALVTRLFIISKDKLLQIKAFKTFYDWFKDKKEWLYSELRKLRAWQLAREGIAQLKTKLRFIRRKGQ
jgi:hypothetical protein